MLCSVQVLAQEAETDAPNTGQDVTKPVQRIDLRLGYVSSPSDLETTTFILRYDKPIPLGGGWQIGLRFDAPFVYNNVPSLDNPTGDWGFGYGDTLAQALLIKAIDKRQAIGFGTQVIAPTESEDQFGSGRWRVVPTFGYRYALPEISPGSFFVGAVRYDTDFAGDDDRGHTSNLQFSPTLNIALPDQMFFTLFPSTDIRYDFIADDWFVPFNAMIGKLWGKSTVTSLEIGVPIYEGDAPLYQFKAEGRIGFFF
jgi:hypothetical protein